MKAKYPHQHILKNLLHEQATEIVTLLLPQFQVKQALDIEIPELKSYVLCPFPQSIPAPVHEEFMGETIMSFNFPYIKLWEKDAREILNAHATSAYFLLPAMKNADAI